MLIKWIVCTVAPEKRDLFSEAQAKWADVRQVPGFRGQMGGWNAKREGEACVLAFWEDEAAYQNFMQHHHDPIYEKTEQRGTYDGIRVTQCRSEQDGMLQSLTDAALLRVAFVNKQAGVWDPGLKQADGMLAGVIGEVPADPNLLLVAELWKSEDAHPADGEAAAFVVPLEPAWLVLPAR